MHASVARNKVQFDSGPTHCAAWWYPGTNGACVIMAADRGLRRQRRSVPRIEVTSMSTPLTTIKTDDLFTAWMRENVLEAGPDVFAARVKGL